MIDGVFIKYLVQELQVLSNQRINKVITINNNEVALSLSSKSKLLINTNSDNMHVRLTNIELVSGPHHREAVRPIPVLPWLRR